MILEQTIDLAGKIRILWEAQDKSTHLFKFDEMPSTQLLEQLAVKEKQIIENRHLKLFNTNEEYFDTALFLYEFLRAQPAMTVAQFNSYLNTLPWYRQVELKYVLYKIGTRITEKGKLDLTNATEAQFFNKLIAFIANSTQEELNKLFSISQ